MRVSINGALISWRGTECSRKSTCMRITLHTQSQPHPMVDGTLVVSGTNTAWSLSSHCLETLEIYQETISTRTRWSRPKISYIILQGEHLHCALTSKWSKRQCAGMVRGGCRNHSAPNWLSGFCPNGQVIFRRCRRPQRRCFQMGNLPTRCTFNHTLISWRDLL